MSGVTQNPSVVQPSANHTTKGTGVTQTSSVSQ